MSNQAALAELQAQLLQQQQWQQHQQEDMAALRAQIQQSERAAAANAAVCAELRTGLQQLQQRVEQCCRDIVQHADQLLGVAEQQQVCACVCEPPLVKVFTALRFTH